MGSSTSERLNLAHTHSRKKMTNAKAKKCLVTKRFLKNHAKTKRKSCQQNYMSVVAKNYCFATKHSGFVARQNLFKTFPFSENASFNFCTYIAEQVFSCQEKKLYFYQKIRIFWQKTSKKKCLKIFKSFHCLNLAILGQYPIDVGLQRDMPTYPSLIF